MAMMKLAKKGKTVMMFIQVLPKFDKKEADQLTERWHQMLFNAQFQIQRLNLVLNYMCNGFNVVIVVHDSVIKVLCSKFL